MRRLKQLYTAFREQACVSYAKIAVFGRFYDLDLLVIKATTPDDFPLPEKCIHDLLRIFSHSPSLFRMFALSFTRRFGRTCSWRVALKCLVLLHRLIRSLNENSSFASDLFSCRANGLISLYPCRFRDSSSSNPEDFTVFIRSYARLLDEAIDFLPANLKKDKIEYPSDTFEVKMKELGRVIEVLPQLQSLIDRVVDCKPLGSVHRNFLIRLAMKQIVRDSFDCYAEFRRDSVLLLDNLFQMPYRNCISVFGIYKKAAIQAVELNEFYESCREMGLCGGYEYPSVDKIPRLQVQALESFLNGMWQLTDTSSSEWTSPEQSLTTDNSERRLVQMETLVCTEWEKFEDGEEEEEEEPLIRFDCEENTSWEILLEASAYLPPINRDHLFLPSAVGYGLGYGNQNYSDDQHKEGLQMQAYNPSSINPFYNTCAGSYHHHNYNAVCATELHHPWAVASYGVVSVSEPNSPWTGSLI